MKKIFITYFAFILAMSAFIALRIYAGDALAAKASATASQNTTVSDEDLIAQTEETASEAMYDPDYSYTAGNILHNWIHILIFILVFALLSVVTLEFIDKDKR